MKIIDAVWEKENLGVTCQEIVVNDMDRIDELKETLNHIYSDYSIVKISPNMPNHMVLIQNLGYQYIETNIQMLVTKDSFVLPDIYKRYLNDVNYHLATIDEQRYILDHILSGNIFDTDKIAIDPLFSKKHSGKRYYNWSKQILESKGRMYAIYFKKEMIGFSLNYSVKSDESNAFLGGLLPQYRNKGLGFLPIYVNTLSSFDNDEYKIRTGVSSNNFPILRLHLSLGFIIEKLTYVLVKHNKGV
jgi:hypothetical protein